jgi:translation elongation factor EF-1beta
MVELREELIESLRRSGRIIMRWTAFRNDEKQELEETAYGLYTIAMMLKNFTDKEDTDTIAELLQRIYNRIECLRFEEFEDRMELAVVKTYIREVIYNVRRI